MPEALALLQKLGGVSFATLLGLILFGSYYDIWVWGKRLREEQAAFDEMKKEYERRLLHAEEASNEWKAMTFRVAGLAEDGVVIAKRKVMHDAP